MSATKPGSAPRHLERFISCISSRSLEHFFTQQFLDTREFTGNDRLLSGLPPYRRVASQPRSVTGLRHRATPCEPGRSPRRRSRSRRIRYVINPGLPANSANRSSSSGSPILCGSKMNTRPTHSCPKPNPTDPTDSNGSTLIKLSRNAGSASRKRFPLRSNNTASICFPFRRA